MQITAQERNGNRVYRTLSFEGSVLHASNFHETHQGNPWDCELVSYKTKEETFVFVAQCRCDDSSAYLTYEKGYTHEVSERVTKSEDPLVKFVLDHIKQVGDLNCGFGVTFPAVS